jgi:hypothetical protein
LGLHIKMNHARKLTLSKEIKKNLARIRWMRSSRVVRASACQWKGCNCSGFESEERQIKAVMNTYSILKIPKITLKINLTKKLKKTQFKKGNDLSKTLVSFSLLTSLAPTADQNSRSSSGLSTTSCCTQEG